MSAVSPRLPSWYYGITGLTLGISLLRETREFFFQNGPRWVYILLLAFTLSTLATPFCR